MKMLKKTQMVIFFLLFIFTLVTGIIFLSRRLTYLERYNFNTQDDTSYEVGSNEVVLTQEFIAPYDMLSRIGIKIGTHMRINNSQWDVKIIDPSDGHTVCSKIVNASHIQDNQYYDVIFNNRNYHVQKGNKYELRIQSSNTTEDTGLTFYVSNKPVDGTNFYADGQLHSGSLCLKIYGGDTDYWWIRFFIIVMIWIAVMAGLYFKDGAAGMKTVKENVILQSMLIAFVSFLLWMTFSVNGVFTDENDNIRAGIEISKGAVLYRDYVTQHTPVVSYLCAIFALFGATSIAQMRLSFYITGAIIWGILYYRHSHFFGRRKMLLLPVLEAIFIPSIVQPQGWMILSDSVQGVCMVMLALEFIRYLYDNKLNFVRSIVISVGVWGSFGSAFVSAYALILLFILVIIREIQMASGMRVTVKSFVSRYYKLFLAILIPFIAAVIYFCVNHALRAAYNLTYKFNTDVYSAYEDGFGTRRLQPLINAFQNFFGLLADNVSSIVQAQATNAQIIQLLFMAAAIGIIVRLFLQKKHYESLMFFFLICGNATRGYGFHGLAAWYIVIAIVSIHYNMTMPEFERIRIPIVGCLAVFMLSIYVGSIGDNLLTGLSPVSEIETAAVEKTDDGDQVLIDTYMYDSLYLLYKNRYPANRCTYFLPWYMEWYEQATIDDMEYWRPKVIIYNPDSTVWTDYTKFTPVFLKKVQESYARGSDNPDDWMYSFWVRK